MKVNGVEIRQANVLKAREHFIQIAKDCKGVKANDQESWSAFQDDHIRDLESGGCDRSLTLLQYAYYLQTGESVPILR